MTLLGEQLLWLAAFQAGDWPESVSLSYVIISLCDIGKDLVAIIIGTGDSLLISSGDHSHHMFLTAYLFMCSDISHLIILKDTTLCLFAVMNHWG